MAHYQIYTEKDATIYEKYPHAWGIGKWKEYDKEVQKKVVNIKKLNLSDSFYINGK